MGMMSTIPATRAEVEREVVPPSYSRYGYEINHPRYQSLCSVEAIYPAETELYSCRYLPIYCYAFCLSDLIVVHYLQAIALVIKPAEPPNNFGRFFAQIPKV
jgi:hypothetical protein